MLQNNLTLYIHVGAHGTARQTQYSYGGGGLGQVGGGGATDVRLHPGPYYNETGLKSRIMAAAGGGGHDVMSPAGSGGGIKGFDSDGKGGNQTSGGDGFYKGRFGLGGGNGAIAGNNGNAGAGGGYFGGGTSFDATIGSAGGGSSYISGYPGCISVDKNFTMENPIFSTADDPSIHYSGIKFENPKMRDGNSIMPSPILNKYTPEIGHYGNGHAIIAPLSENYFPKNYGIPIRILCSFPLKIGRNLDSAYFYFIMNLFLC